MKVIFGLLVNKYFKIKPYQKILIFRGNIIMSKKIYIYRFIYIYNKDLFIFIYIYLYLFIDLSIV